MAKRYHVNTEGNVGPCGATKGICPFGGEDDHFSTAEDARKAYEKVMSLGGSWATPAKPKAYATVMKNPSEISFGDRVYLDDEGRDPILIEVDFLNDDGSGFAGIEVGTNKRYGSPLLGNKNALTQLAYRVVIPASEINDELDLAQRWNDGVNNTFLRQQEEARKEAVTREAIQVSFANLDEQYVSMSNMAVRDSLIAPHYVKEMAEVLEDRNLLAQQLGEPVIKGLTPQEAFDTQMAYIKDAFQDLQLLTTAEEAKLLEEPSETMTFETYDARVEELRERMHDLRRLNLLINEDMTQASRNFEMELRWKEVRLDRQRAAFKLLMHERNKPNLLNRRAWQAEKHALENNLAAAEKYTEDALTAWRG